MSKTSEAVLKIVASLPKGSCASYGFVGCAVEPPISGLLVGRILARAPGGIPWWRVVGRDGSLLVGRKDPRLALEQEARLVHEGVSFEEGRVSKDCLNRL